MSKFEKLAAINKIANECVQDGDFVLASRFHNEFMKIAQEKRTYKVKDFQELLIDIADKTGVSVLQLQAYNPKIRNVVTQGTIVNLGPAPRKDPPGYYTVGSGDNASIIADKFKTNIEMLKKLNPDKKLSLLYPGDKIKVPVMKSSLDESPMDLMAEEMPEMPEM
jgi:LysM repeat protein